MATEVEMHTPGPWTLDDSPDLRFRVYCDDATGSMVAITGGKPFNMVARSDEESDANARLIAATPDLYEALKAFVAVTDDACLVEKDSPHAVFAEPLRTALAALRKAQGQP